MTYAIDASRATRPAFYTPPSPSKQDYMPFQAAGVEYALCRDHVLLGDEPGLGKTIQAIGISNAIEATHSLVICPASLRLNWQLEVQRWTVHKRFTYPILKSSDGVSTQANWVFISYDLLRSNGIFEALLDLQWDHLILDEAHYLKDPKGNARTARLLGKGGIRETADRITCLSGSCFGQCVNGVKIWLTNYGFLPKVGISTRLNR